MLGWGLEQGLDFIKQGIELYLGQSLRPMFRRRCQRSQQDVCRWLALLEALEPVGPILLKKFFEMLAIFLGPTPKFVGSFFLGEGSAAHSFPSE